MGDINGSKYQKDLFSRLVRTVPFLKASARSEQVALITATLRLLLTSMQFTPLSDLLYSQIRCMAEHQ
jgi:hypothetical protein